MRPEHWVHTIPLRLRSLFRRSLADHELDEELRYHIESKTAHHIANGMSPEQARRAALLELGGIEQTKEACRDQRKLNLIEDLVQDVSHGLRLLRKNSGFTAIAVLTLALGIGANTAIFTLIHAVMLKTLPVAKPGELYRLGDDDNCCVVGGLQGNFSIFSHALYKHLRDNTPEFSQLAAFDAAPAKFSVRRSESSGPAVPFIGEFVSGNYFQMFGVDAVSGRVLTNEDDRPGEAPVAVLSYRTWRDQFGLAPAVVHSTLIINGFAVVVTGVAPPGFYGDTLRSDPPDFWLPLASEPTFHHERPLLNEAGEHWLYVIGRLKQDAEPVAVQTRVTVELQQWLSEYGDLAPEERNSIQQQKIILAPAAGGVETLSAEYAEGFRLLMIASGLVLLIACANIACLLLAQGSAARLATAIRVALGATRSRLIRQALSEGVLLALLGGAAGLAVAYFGARAILLIAFRGARFVPIDAAPSVPVLGFALAVSLLTGLIFSSAPAWMASKVLPGEILGGAGRSRQDRTSLPRRSLVVLQTSLSLILLVAAGLLLQSLRRLECQQFGFETRGRVIVKVDPVLAGYTVERLAGLYTQLDQRLAEIPGVVSASYSLYSPMEGRNWSGPINIEGRPPATNSDERIFASWNRVSASYFETIGTRLIRGRLIDQQDTPASPRVTVISEAFARKFFPKERTP